MYCRTQPVSYEEDGIPVAHSAAAHIAYERPLVLHETDGSSDDEMPDLYALCLDSLDGVPQGIARKEMLW